MDAAPARRRSGTRVRVILVIFAAIFLGGVWYTLHVLGTGDDSLIQWIASKSPARVKANLLVRQALSSDPATRNAGEAGIAALRRSGDIKALVEAIACNVGLVVDARNEEGDGYRLCGLVGGIGAPAIQPLLDLYRGGLRQDSYPVMAKWFPLYPARLDSRRAVVVHVAREALARMGEPLVGPLVAMAGSKSQEDQWIAIGLFRAMKGPAGTTALIRIVNTTKGTNQSVAVQVLLDQASPLAADTFATLAPTWQRLYDNGYFAIIGLGRLKDPRAIEGLCRMLKGPQSLGHAIAASLLGSYGDAQVEKALVEALQDSDRWVRLAAATSLGKMGSPAALALLEPLQSDKDPAVCTAARDAIAQIKARTGKAPAAPRAGEQESR